MDIKDTLLSANFWIVNICEKEIKERLCRAAVYSFKEIWLQNGD